MAEYYASGFCVSERAMQHGLASCLQVSFRERELVIEPSWKTEVGHFIPDIVMLEGSRISDIFELKFVPHGYANFNVDIGKLQNYAKLESAIFPVRIEPSTGKWAEESYSLSPSLELHYVVIARSDSEAVFPKCVGRGNKGGSSAPRLNHWFGRVCDNFSDEENWNIAHGI